MSSNKKTLKPIPFDNTIDDFTIWKYRVEQHLKSRDLYYILTANVTIKSENQNQNIQQNQIQSTVTANSTVNVTTTDDTTDETKLNPHTHTTSSIQTVPLNNTENAIEIAQVSSFLAESLRPNILKQHSNLLYQHPSYLWQAICAQFDRKTVVNKYALRDKLQKNILSSSEHINEYIGRIVHISERLNTMQDCVSETDKLHSLFNGLPTSYDALKTTLRLLPNITFEEVCTHLQDHYESINIKSVGNGTNEKPMLVDINESAHVSNERFRRNGFNNFRGRGGSNNFNFRGHGRGMLRSNYQNNSGNGQKLYNCQICRMDNHNINDCNFNGKVNGKNKGNSNFRSGGNSNSNSNSNFRSTGCFVCGGNHLARNCSKGYRQNEHNMYSNINDVSTDVSGEARNNVNDDCDEYAWLASVLSNKLSNMCNLQKSATSNCLTRFILDSGASSHYTNQKSLLSDIKYFNIPIKVGTANGETINVYESGTIKLHLANGKRIILSDVKYSPHFTSNLLSITTLMDRGVKFQFQNNTASIICGNQVVVNAYRDGSLMYIDGVCESGNKISDNVLKNHDFMYKGVKCESAYSVGDSDKFELIHARLGHLSKSSIKNIIENHAVDDLDDIKIDMNEKHICSSCLAGKQQRKSFKNVSKHEKASEILERIHLDTIGPIKIEKENPIIDRLGHFQYISIITDEKSRRIFAKCIKNKSEIPNHIINFITTQEKQTNKVVKSVHSDNSKEYLSNELQSFLSSKGIIFTSSYEYTPQNNGLAERTNRTLMEMVRCLLFGSNLSAVFWSAAVAASCYLLNFRISKGDPDASKSPHQLWYGKKPSIKHLRIFGSDCYMVINKPGTLSKLDSKTNKSIFIGYSVHKLHGIGYIVYDITNHTIHVSRDVIFEEGKFTVGRTDYNIMPRLKINFQPINNENIENRIDDTKLQSDREMHVVVESNEIDDENDIIDTEAIVTNNSTSDINLTNYYKVLSETESKNQNSSNEIVAASSTSTNLNSNSNTSASSKSSEIIRSPIATRTRSKSVFAVPSEAKNSKSTQSVRRSSRKRVNSSLRTNFDDIYDVDRSESNLYALYGNNIKIGKNVVDDDLIEPLTYSEAVGGTNSEKWKKSMDEEMDALIANKTWILVKPPVGVNIVDSKWVYRIKRDENNHIVKFKSRLVARGFSQKEYVDYDPNTTYAPVVRHKSLKILLSIANSNDQEIHQFDVTNAYLNSDLNEVIYMKQACGYEKGNNMVYKLQKSLYGTKQAGSNWYSTLSDFIINELKFIRLKTDSCVYIKYTKNGRLLIITTFVDDIVVFYDMLDVVEFNECKSMFMNKFSMKDLGPISFLLGYKITRDREKRTLKMSQSQYVRTILEKYGMSNCNGESTPVSTSMKFTKLDCPQNENEKEKMKNLHAQYYSCVGAINYIGISTRPDLAFASLCLSRFMSNPGHVHYVGMKRCLRYLKATSHLELTYVGSSCETSENSNSTVHNSYSDVKVKNRLNNENAYLKSNVYTYSSTFNLTAWSDSTWADSNDDMKSTTGIVIKLNNDCIVWSSKRQQTVALSSCEAELYALGATIQDIIYVQQFMNELNYNLNIILLCDNKSTISLARHDHYHSKTKHINLKYYFIREFLNSKNHNVQLDWVDSEQNCADALTKSLNKTKFKYFISEIMNLNDDDQHENVQQQCEKSKRNATN